MYIIQKLNMDIKHIISIILDNAYIDLNADGETAEKINLTFSHKENPKNFGAKIQTIIQ